MDISISLFEFINTIILFSISLVGIVLCFIIYLKRDSNFSYNHYCVKTIMLRIGLKENASDHESLDYTPLCQLSPKETPLLSKYLICCLLLY